jgi:AP endonuclease-2
VDSRGAVPLRAEEGITGLLLSEAGGAMRPPWVEVEKIGNFADLGDLELEPNENGEFDPRSLDVEGRAVVLDFG